MLRRGDGPICDHGYGRAMNNLDLDLHLDTGGTVNISGNDLSTDDLTKLQTAVDSLNPTNADEARSAITAAMTD
jgi:hypothetical protein